MKKQLNPTTKAHLIRSAFYVLLLLAVCVIPFALAQSRSRATINRSAAQSKAAANTTFAAAGAPASVSSAQREPGAVDRELPYDLRASSAQAPKYPYSSIRDRWTPMSKAANAQPIAPVGSVRRHAEAPNLSAWSIVADYPEAVNAPAVCSDGTFAYSAGGSNGVFTTAGFYRYDPIANTWTTLASLPTALVEARAAYAANVNKIYVFGGSDVPGHYLNTTYIYDIATDSWTTGASMPDDRYFPNVAYYGANGKIYVIGGFDANNSEQGQTWEYDPVANTWDTSRTAAPQPMAGSATSIVGQNIYLAGSFDRPFSGTILHYRYDISADSWTQMADVPLPVYEAAGAAIGTNTYVVGGGDPALGPSAIKHDRIAASTHEPAISYRSTYIYDTLTDTWTVGPNTNVRHAFTGGTAIGNLLIVVAGFNGVTGAGRTVETATEGPTPTPSPTPTPLCTPIVISGSIDNGDPMQNDRLFRTGAPQTCPASTICGVFGEGQRHHYDSYTFTNTTGATQCVTVDTNTACTDFNVIFVAAYLGSFDPENICNNWIGDSGSSPIPEQAFSFTIEIGQTFVIVVSEVTPDAGCPSYTMAITGLCGGGGTPTPTASPTCTPASSPWNQANPYPTTICRYGWAQTATHFYVFGGISDGNEVNNVNSMDLATGIWEPRAPMPFTSEAPTCALMADTGMVFCAEGELGNHFASYDTVTDRWTTLAAIPGGDHYGSASGAFNGKVFVAGGTEDVTDLVQVYDVATNSWLPGTDAPSEFLLAGYQQVGQFLYIVGGFGLNSPGANKLTTYRLDMSSAPGVWDTGPTFTPARADFGLAYDAGTGKLYALGGDATGGSFFDSTNLVDELDLANWPGGTWNPSPPDLPLPNRQSNQAGFFGAGQIWTIGGVIGPQPIQFLAEVQVRTDGVCATPTPTPTATPSATATPTATSTATPSATATATATATPSATATPTPIRFTPTPRPRPTPFRRPTPP